LTLVQNNKKKGVFVSTRKILFGALLAAATMAMSSTSMAQFDSIYFGGGFTRFKATETFTDPVSVSSVTFGNDSHQGGFNGFLGYGLGLGSLVHIALEGSYSSQVGQASATAFGVTTNHGLEEAAALSILPGLKFTPTGLFYARIGAAQAKYKDSQGTFSQTHKGTLFGVGMKQEVARHAALLVEFQNYVMKEKDGLKPESTGVLLGFQFSLR